MTSHYLRFFRWHVLRYLGRHRLLALLNVLSVALGVAVYLAIQIANHSANRAFAATVDLVAGKADLQLTGSVASRTRRSRWSREYRRPIVGVALPHLLRGFPDASDAQHPDGV